MRDTRDSWPAATAFADAVRRGLDETTVRVYLSLIVNPDKPDKSLKPARHKAFIEKTIREALPSDEAGVALERLKSIIDQDALEALLPEESGKTGKPWV